MGANSSGSMSPIGWRVMPGLWAATPTTAMVSAADRIAAWRPRPGWTWRASGRTRAAALSGQLAADQLPRRNLDRLGVFSHGRDLLRASIRGGRPAGDGLLGGRLDVPVGAGGSGGVDAGLEGGHEVHELTAGGR